MAKKSKSTPDSAGPINGVLTLTSNGKLVIVAADGSSHSLEEIANLGNDGGTAELTVMVGLSKTAYVRSKDRVDLRDAIGALGQFLGERALSSLILKATCGNNPPAPAPARAPTPDKPPKAPKPGKR